MPDEQMNYVELMKLLEGYEARPGGHSFIVEKKTYEIQFPKKKRVIELIVTITEEVADVKKV